MQINKTDLDIAQSATLADMTMCLNHYRLSTPGLYICVHVPVQIDAETKIVPGLVAQVNSGVFKQCDPGDFNYFRRPPNFIFDVFKDNQGEEYEYRRKLFERNRVIEYVAWKNSASLPVWNRLVGGKFEEVVADDEGLIKSTALPGLWVHVQALRNRDWWMVLASISRGVTRQSHGDFMTTIWRKSE
jgi:hypothetical protein